MANYLRPATDLKDLHTPGPNSEVPEECLPECDEACTKGPTRESQIGYLNSVPRSQARQKAQGWAHSEELRDLLNSSNPEQLTMAAEALSRMIGEPVAATDLLQGTISDRVLAKIEERRP